MAHQGFVEIERALKRDERLIWSGQPRQGMYFRSDDWLLVPFSVMWGGFAIFWEAQGFSTGASLFFRLWGIPFVLVGTNLMVGRFLFDARSRRHIYYGLTNQRVIVIGGRMSNRINTYPLSRIPEIKLDLYADGTGTIDFEKPARRHGKYGGNSGCWHSDAMSKLERITDARFVYDTIVDLQRSISLPSG